jgi:iron-sulfur cluster repair protein YtfE (RIC family)
VNEIKRRLIQDHREIDALLQSLSEDATAPGRAPLQSTWSQLENRLICHMEAEEHFLLPLIADAHPTEVTRTRREHVQIRHLISELGVAVDLHTARQPAIDALISVLRDHANKEDSVLYGFAGDEASSSIHEKLSKLLLAGQQAIVGAPSSHDKTVP